MLTRATSHWPTTKGAAGNGLSLSRSIASNSERRLPSRGGANGRLFHSSIFSASAALASASEKNCRWRSGASTHISNQSDRIFRGRFVPWLSDPCRDNRYVVMAAERGIAAVQHRVPVVGGGHPGLEGVGDLLLRAAADIGEGADMGTEPVLVTLGPARFGVGQVRAGQAGNENLRLADDTLVDDHALAANSLEGRVG